MADLLSELERFDQEMKQLISETSASDIPPDSQPGSNGAVSSQEQSVDGIVTASSKPSPSASSKTTSLSGVSSQAWVSSSTDHGTPQFTYLQGPSFPVPAPPVATTFYPQYGVQQYQPQQQLQPPVPQYQYQGIYPSITTPEIYSHPQQQQAQVLFQKDAQTITPEALENVKAALASGDGELKSDAKRKAIPRKAAGQTWEDPSLAEWPENDYRLFCGDLGNEVNDEVLTKAFTRFPSFNMARVVRDKRTGKTKGYGFVSFSNPSDLAIAMKEMNGKYVGNRPIKLRKSNWKERIDFDALEKQKLEKQKNAKKPRLRKNVLHK